MFTEEEKIRAIELYFKYGKKLAPDCASDRERSGGNEAV